MRDFIDDVAIPLFVIAALCGAVFVGIGAIVVGWDYLDCKGFGKSTGIETRWWWGCYAKADGEWMPKSYVYGDRVNEIRLKDKREKRGD